MILILPADSALDERKVRRHVGVHTSHSGVQLDPSSEESDWRAAVRFGKSRRFSGRCYIRPYLW